MDGNRVDINFLKGPTINLNHAWRDEHFLTEKPISWLVRGDGATNELLYIYDITVTVQTS